MLPSRTLPVVIVGAGPYGLSIAAHLGGAGIETRVFGRAMDTWATGMPPGMFLKSAAMATDLSDPGRRYTLARHCAERGIPYHPFDMPLPVEMFTAYGREFQRRFVPHLEEQFVTRLARGPAGFTLTLDDGARVDAAQVVLATGLRRFGAVPRQLAGLPPERLSHSSDSGDLVHLRGRDVVVLGGGSSAVDVAAALHRSGARATLVARRPELRFPPRGAGRRRWYHALRAPMTPLGPGWNKVMAWKGPLLFRHMPAEFRSEVLRRYLGPSPTLSVKETVLAHVPLALGAELVSAREAEGRVRLGVRQGGAERVIEADHVFAATGYAIELDRLGFIDRDIVADLDTHRGYPRLTADFGSSVPGLHFVGTPAAAEFGPMLRFVCGTEFCAKRITRRLLALGLGRGVPSRAAPGAAARRMAVDPSREVA